MAKGHFGSEEYVTRMVNKTKPYDNDASLGPSILQPISDTFTLRNRISDLEYELSQAKLDIKEVPIETIRYVETKVNIPIERIVDRIIETKVEVPVIQECIVVKEIPIVVEVIKEVEKVVSKETKFIPVWAYSMLLVETLAIIVLLLK